MVGWQIQLTKVHADEPLSPLVAHRLVIIYGNDALGNEIVVGTGLVVTEGGHVLTAKHVVPNRPQVRVLVQDAAGPQHAVVTYADQFFDLAVLHIEDFQGGVDRLKEQDFILYEEINKNSQLEIYGNPTTNEGPQLFQQTFSSTKRFAAGKVFLNTSLLSGYSGGPALVDGKLAGIILTSSTDGEAYSLPIEFARGGFVDSGS